MHGFMPLNQNVFVRIIKVLHSIYSWISISLNWLATHKEIIPSSLPPSPETQPACDNPLPAPLCLLLHSTDTRPSQPVPYLRGSGVDWPMPTNVNWPDRQLEGKDMTLHHEYILRMREAALFARQIEHRAAGDWVSELSREDMVGMLKTIRNHATRLLELELEVSDSP